MIRVGNESGREPVEGVCNACSDKENTDVFEVRIGNPNDVLNIKLCSSCIDDLYCEIAEALNY